MKENMILNAIKKLWIEIENNGKPPKYVEKINTINFEDLKKNIDNKNFEFIKEIIHKLYAGEAYIIKKAANIKLKDIIIDISIEYDKQSKSSFHKMLDGTPNFHRIIDHDITQKYSLYAIKHSYYLYNWNTKTKNESEFIKETYKHWRYIKYLAGNSKKAFEKNIPSNGQIDRFQIVNYPHGGGQLRDHEDPRKNQKLVSGLIMSKKGVDFQTGGFYFKNKKNENENIEDKLEIGDSVMFYGSIIHGVEPVDSHKEIDWSSKNGRWFIGMFVNDSDHIINRITAQDLTNSTEYKSLIN